MFSKAKIVIAAVLVLGLASAAQAGGKDDADSNGGYVVTPTGSGVNQALHPEIFGQPAQAYAAVPHQPVSKNKKANTR
jgi:hypothetical protein